MYCVDCAPPQVLDGGEILLESQQSDGSWALAGFRSEDVTSLPAATKAALTPQEIARPRGLVGLFNLGNTCYLNSAVQVWIRSS